MTGGGRNERARHEREIAKLFALGVRNGVEDLHASGLFEDAQAPLFNQLVRGRIYEALIALSAGTAAASDWVIDYCDLEEDDPLKASLRPACDEAVREFAEHLDLSPEDSEQLVKAAQAGLLETIELYNRAIVERDEAAQKHLGFLTLMVPDYWEDPKPRPEFLSDLDLGELPESE